MRDVAVVVLFIMALPVLAFALCLSYAALIESLRGARLSLGAMRARRAVRRAGGAQYLSDADLELARVRLAARMALKPLYRRPAWLRWGHDLKEEVECQLLTREAQALLR